MLASFGRRSNSGLTSRRARIAAVLRHGGSLLLFGGSALGSAGAAVVALRRNVRAPRSSRGRRAPRSRDRGDAASCPTPAELAAELASIFPDLVVAGGGGDELGVELAVGPDRIHVRAGASSATLPARESAPSARKIAVFVALALEPPTVDLPEPAPVAAVQAAPARRALATQASPSVQLDAAAAFEATPSASNGLAAAGGELGIFLGGEHIGAVVSITGLSPAQLTVPETTARLTRVPIAAGARARMRRGQLGLALEAGVAAALLVADGLDAMVGTVRRASSSACAARAASSTGSVRARPCSPMSASTSCRSPTISHCQRPEPSPQRRDGGSAACSASRSRRHETFPGSVTHMSTGRCTS